MALSIFAAETKLTPKPAINGTPTVNVFEIRSSLSFDLHKLYPKPAAGIRKNNVSLVAEPTESSINF